MQPSRQRYLAITYLLAAFLLGGVLGYLTGHSGGSATATRMVDQQKATVDVLGRELSLSGTQRNTIDSIMSWRLDRSREITRVVRPELDAVRDSARNLIINTLDSSQAKAFHEMIERNQRAADSTARSREENP